MFKNLFKKKKKVNLQEVRSGNVIHNFIYQNDHVDIIQRACKICYDKEPCNTYEEKVEYIKKVLGKGHESILEHSSLINVYVIDQTLYRELCDILSASRYVNTRVRFDEDLKVAYLLVGGQIRGYKEIIREIYNPNNPIAKAIIESLYVTNSCYFGDFIEDGIMQEDLFYAMGDVDIKFKEESVNKYLDIINIDPVDLIYRSIKQFGFSYEDAIEVSSMTLFIKDISRIISQMVTRHDFGITQMSQRYVNYSDVGFNAPYLFKPDKYDKDKLYDIKIQADYIHDILINQDELGKMLMDIYPQLLEQGMLKEDARGYIPQNNQTSLYITGEFKKVFNFQKLRTHKSTQAELRESIALPLDPILDSIIEDKYQYLEPKYRRYELELEEEYNDNTEEVIGKVEERYEKIPEFDEVIKEDEDGNLHYNKEDFI